MALLDVQNLSKKFGGLVAVDGVNFQVDEGQIFGIIGPNGAGKTTLYNLITGVFKPTGGKIFFQEKNITKITTYHRASRGLVRTFQTASLFHQMTALENMDVAHHLSRKSRGMAQFFATPGFRKENRRLKERAVEILDYLGLSDVQGVIADNLPHGHQRALGIAIALAADPKILLLDEPVTGMDDTETSTMTNIIKGLRDDMGITIILVEHDMTLVMQLAEWIVVLDHGRKIAEGTAEQVRKDRKVIAAYLGQEEP